MLPLGDVIQSLTNELRAAVAVGDFDVATRRAERLAVLCAIAKRSNDSLVLAET
jgi:hypothetical protein